MKFPYPCLCLVTDRKQCEGRTLEEVVDQAVTGGVNMVQVREKDLSAAELFSLTSRIKEVVDGRALLFVNDRADVALACGADGVQLGEEGLPIGEARRISEGKLRIGRSVHSVKGAVDAEACGADFLIVGTIFPTNSHPGASGAGVGLLREISMRVRIPFIGIGGINKNNIASVMSNRASGAAVITGITRSATPLDSAKALKQAMSAPHKHQSQGEVAGQV